uniref:Uncharacterized protein n=1 Tax=Oryza sativa subsp. japonica TaxID=39947 RepID=Q6Z1T6_ORYSJ|nr:hypothetical protein [Oryza sativa Japonica Group]BAD27758.1 hypothetical protein [Oryza sativa Japonica Group]
MALVDGGGVATAIFKQCEGETIEEVGAAVQTKEQQGQGGASPNNARDRARPHGAEGGGGAAKRCANEEKQAA